MPTKAEFDALKNVAGSAWDDTGTVKGYRFGTSTNQIFLPAAGYGNGTDLYDVGDGGFYWSSSLDAGDPDSACNLDFIDTDADTFGGLRYDGRSIRAIIDEPEKEIHQDDDNEKYKHENPEWFGEE